jgi:hypothetical protein
MNLRKPTDQDILRFKECLLADEYHCTQKVEDWLAVPGEFMVFFDEEENRVFVRIEHVLRVHFQHDQKVPRRKLIPIIYKAFFWLMGMARNKQFSELIFESRSKSLILFIEKLFGTKPVEANYFVRT